MEIYFHHVDCFQQIVFILNVFIRKRKKKLKPVESAHEEKYNFVLHYLICFFWCVMYLWPDQLTVSKGLITVSFMASHCSTYLAAVLKPTITKQPL